MSDALVMQAANRILHQNTLDRLKQIANGELSESELKKEENTRGAEKNNPNNSKKEE